MSTNASSHVALRTAGRDAVVPAAYALGALLLAGQAVVHVQQYFSIYHEVRWIGPLFLADAVASLATVAGLAYRPTRPFAAVAGIAISVLALGGLVVSYGQGLFGWHELGFRTSIALAVIAEVGAVVLLSIALSAQVALRGRWAHS